MHRWVVYRRPNLKYSSSTPRDRGTSYLPVPELSTAPVARLMPEILHCTSYFRGIQKSFASGPIQDTRPAHEHALGKKWVPRCNSSKANRAF